MAEEDGDSDLSADDWAAAMAEQESSTATPGSPPPTTAAMFPEFSGDAPAEFAPGRLDMVLDIPVHLTVELGRAKIPIRNLLQLAQGSVVELGRLAGEPLDVLVNGCLIARGEVVVVNEKFGIRLTDVVAPDARLRQANR